MCAVRCTVVEGEQKPRPEIYQVAYYEVCAVVLRFMFAIGVKVNNLLSFLRSYKLPRD